MGETVLMRLLPSRLVVVDKPPDWLTTTPPTPASSASCMRCR